MSAYDLVRKAKEISKIKSDYELSEKLSVSRGQISNWKSGRNNPDGVTMLRLAELAELNPHDALNLVTRPAQTASGALSQTARMMYIM